MTRTNSNDDWNLLFDRPAAEPQVRSATDLGQAIERSFKYPSEGISIIWRGETIRVPYAYGVSDILDDVLEMLEALSASQGEGYHVAFSSDEPGGVDADWILSWEDDALSIDADWRSAPGGLKDQMHGHSRLLTSKQAFINNWIDALLFLCQATSSVKLEHREEVCTILRLGALFQR